MSDRLRPDMVIAEGVFKVGVRSRVGVYTL